MSTAIKSIFDAVAAWTFTVDGRVIRCRNYNELKDQLNQGDCPVRMLMIPGGTEARRGVFIALGKAQNIEWVIEDRLYWKPAGAGQGLADFSGELTDYLALYVERVRSNRAPTSQSYIREVRCIPSFLRWPDHDAGEPYVGMQCLLTVEEYITGA